MDKMKVTFFFGAGAEGKGNFDLPSGYEFMNDTLFQNTYLEKVCKALSEFWENKEFFKSDGRSYSYSRNKEQPYKAMGQNLIYQKALADSNYKNNYKEKISLYLSEQQLKELELSKKHEPEKPKESKKLTESEKITNCFKDIFNHSMDKVENIDKSFVFIKDLFTDTNGKIDFNGTICTAGILERNFHTIIDPVRYGPARFSKVINYYWTCFFVIVTKLIQLCPEEFQDILGNIPKSDGEIKDSFFQKILENLHEVISKIYQHDFSEIREHSYYNLIRNQKELLVDGIITTNYSDLCAICRPLASTASAGCSDCFDSSDIIHLNGELKYFEFPENMEVLDYKESKDRFKNNEKLFFPFIFGQSSIKPIVHPVQVTEYFKFQKVLERTKVLVMLGYGINEDDNHINAYLHRYIKKGGKLIYVADDKMNSCNEYKKLRVDENDIIRCRVNYEDSQEIIMNCIVDSIKAAYTLVK